MAVQRDFEEEILSIYVGGKIHAGWSSLMLKRTQKELVGTFTLKSARFHPDRGHAQLVKPGSKAVITLGQEVVMTSRVNKITPTATNITISGRGLACDLIDCALIHDSGCWEKVRLSSLVAEIFKPFGLSFLFQEGSDPVVSREVARKGDKVWAFLEALLRRHSLKAWSDETGRVIFGRADRFRRAETSLLRRHSGPEFIPDEGNNILDGYAIYDESKRFSEIHVDGQNEGTDGLATSLGVQCSGVAKDLGVARYRPIVMQAEGRATDADCQMQAEWETSNRLAASQPVFLTVAGWRQVAGGSFWREGLIVPVEDDVTQTYKDMLVDDVRFSGDKKSNLRTNLTLVPPETAEPKPEVSVSQESWGDLKETINGS